MFASALSGVITVGAFATVSSAATSGWVYGLTHAGITYCDEATETAVRVSDAYIESNTGTSCGQSHVSAAGILQTEAIEIFNGNACGSAGPSENNVATSYFGVGGSVCGDPGSGNYHTVAAGAYWNSAGMQYLAAGEAVSPDQTYAIATPTAPFTVTPSGMTEGPVPNAAFNGTVLNMSLLPDYISVSSQGEIVGFVQTSLILPVVGQPTGTQSTFPVYNAALNTVVGNLVSGQGFVPAPGTGLPATDSNGNVTTVTTIN